METGDISAKKCSFCGETVRMDWNRCPYCGSLLNIKVDRVQPNIEHDPGSDAAQEVIAGKPEEAGETGSQRASAQPYVQPQASDSSHDGGHTGFSYKQAAGNGFANTAYGGFNGHIESPLSNGMKVFLTVLASVVPGIGQLAGLIAAIVFMNSEGTGHGEDKRSFGLALLIACLVMFIISCIACFILALAFSDSV